MLPPTEIPDGPLMPPRCSEVRTRRLRAMEVNGVKAATNSNDSQHQSSPADSVCLRRYFLAGSQQAPLMFLTPHRLRAKVTH